MTGPTLPHSAPDRPTFAALLASAVNEPGIVSRAYSAFHGFSLTNQMLAMVQCAERGLRPGPLSTYDGWRAKGRQVRRGERGLMLWRPVVCKRTETRADGTTEETCAMSFVLRAYWFSLSQTDGLDVAWPTVPGWDRARALAALDVAEIPFDLTDGNVQGFARARSIAVSPVAALPLKTTIHECAHVLLDHTAETVNDGAALPRSLREAEAESVALLVCESLGLPGAAEARGYIQTWWGAGHEIPESSASRIFRAADAILRAGREAAGAEPA